MLKHLLQERIMRKTLLLSIMMLSGCAGMNTDFDCNKTATDQCLTMEQAQSLASQGKTINDLDTNGESGGKKSVTKPINNQNLINTPPKIKPYVDPNPGRITSAVGNSGGLSNNIHYNTVKVVNKSNPNSAGTVDSVRYQDVTQRLWISPWVDKDDNFHQPAVVEFVKEKSQWKQNFNSIGDGD